WKAAPVRKPGVVASVHDYSWFHPSGQTLADYEASMDARGGYLVTEGTVPLWVGEFGSDTDVPLASMRRNWLPMFIAYAAKRNLHWCWWELCATAVKGTEPSTGTPKTALGQRESFGLMAGQDWLGTQASLLDTLKPIMPALPG